MSVLEREEMERQLDNAKTELFAEQRRAREKLESVQEVRYYCLFTLPVQKHSPRFICCDLGLLGLLRSRCSSVKFPNTEVSFNGLILISHVKN